MLCRAGNTHLIQFGRDPVGAHALQPPLKNVLDDSRCGLVHNKLMLVLRVTLVSVYRVAADVLAAIPLDFELAGNSL